MTTVHSFLLWRISKTTFCLSLQMGRTIDCWYLTSINVTIALPMIYQTPFNNERFVGKQNSLSSNNEKVLHEKNTMFIIKFTRNRIDLKWNASILFLRWFLFSSHQGAIHFQAFFSWKDPLFYVDGKPSMM